MRTAILLLLLASVVLSGCTSCVTGPPVTARDINNANASGGVGLYDLDVLVTDGPGGPPLADSGVVVYWESTRTEEWDGPAVRIGQDDIAIGPAEGERTVEPTQTIRAKSGDDGMVFTNPPANRIVGIVAAHDGFTEEWVPAAATGDQGGGDVMTVPLYRQRLTLEQNGTWDTGAASGAIITENAGQTENDYDWEPLEAEFGAPGDSRRGYAARIVELQVTLTWENDINSAGNLGIGIGPNADEPTYFHDGGNNLEQGLQSETALLSAQDLVDHNILGTFPIHIGPATNSGFVAPLGGLDFTLDIDARFDAALAELTACQGGSDSNDGGGIGVSTPGAAAPLLVAALAVMAAVLRRRES